MRMRVDRVVQMGQVGEEVERDAALGGDMMSAVCYGGGGVWGVDLW